MRKCHGCDRELDGLTCRWCFYRHLPLDKRWSLRERYNYDVRLRSGHFGLALEIMHKHMTPEQIAASNKRAKELWEAFGYHEPDKAPSSG